MVIEARRVLLTADRRETGVRIAQGEDEDGWLVVAAGDIRYAMLGAAEEDVDSVGGAWLRLAVAVLVDVAIQLYRPCAWEVN